MKVTISEAGRLAGISRQHLYSKYINTGTISVERSIPGKPVVDVSELLRVFPTIKLPDSYLSSNGQDMTQDLSSKITDLDKELTATRKQLQDSQDREKWLQGTVDKLTDTLKLLEHKPAAEPVKWWRVKLW